MMQHLHLRRQWLSSIVVLLSLSSTSGQEPVPPDCSTAEAAQFDFWVGSWQVTWSDSASGKNRVDKVLDDCVIVEHFDGRPGGPLQGLSVSTYDRSTQRWRQTWVDNNASYLDFVGGWEGDRMILSRQAQRDGQTFRQRMVWYAIAADSLEWNWERSDDEGETWKVLWQIHYRRQHPDTDEVPGG